MHHYSIVLLEVMFENVRNEHNKPFTFIRHFTPLHIVPVFCGSPRNRFKKMYVKSCEVACFDDAIKVQ